MTSAHHSDLLKIFGYGLGWGCGAVTFGLGVGAVGQSLGFSLILGTCAVLGSIIPLLVLNPDKVWSDEGKHDWVGLAVMCLGLTYIGIAGACKERDQHQATAPPAPADKSIPELDEALLDKPTPEPEPASGSSSTTSFLQGLLICLFSGATCAMANLAFAFGGAIKTSTLAHGASKGNQVNALWVVVMIPVGLVNLLWYGYTVHTEGSWHKFTADDAKTIGVNIAASALMGLLWFGGTVLSGVGEIFIGDLGAVIGWPVYTTVMVLTSNTVGIVQGEWRGASEAAKRWMGGGILIMVCAIVTIGVSDVFMVLWLGVASFVAGGIAMVLGLCLS